MRALVLSLVPLTVTIAYSQRPPLPTIKGPETKGLMKGIAGYLVMEEKGGIDIVSLPGGKLRSIRTFRDPSRDTGAVHTLSGPDKAGRIAFIEANMYSETHALKTIDLHSKKEREIFSRKGDPLWKHSAGEHLALSAKGGKVAFLANCKGVQMYEPPAYLMAGSLEIWDIETKTVRKPGLTGLDDGLAWFPDGKRLAFVQLMTKAELDKAKPVVRLGNELMNKEGFGRGFQKWERIPAVQVLDTAAGKIHFVHIGWRPVVSLNGEKILISDWDRRYRLVDLSEKTSHDVTWPGDWGGPIALLKGDLVLYRGLPTSGSPAKFTEFNSPLVGPKPMGAVKIAQMNTRKFQTIVPYIDPRTEISFGVTKKGQGAFVKDWRTILTARRRHISTFDQ